MTGISEYDAAEYLDSEELIIEYLNVAMEDEDPRYFLKALRNVARARGMMELSRKTGLPRETLYHALSAKGNPSYLTLKKITSALGLVLNVHPAAS